MEKVRTFFCYAFFARNVFLMYYNKVVKPFEDWNKNLEQGSRLIKQQVTQKKGRFFCLVS